MNLSSGKNSGIETIDKFPGVSLTGAYKINHNEFIGGKYYLCVCFKMFSNTLF